MSEDGEPSVNGNTRKVYLFMIKRNKPVGIRETQRALGFSSPTLALYHLEKLKDLGLIKQTPEGYVIDKFVLKDFINLKGLILPRFFFYSIFFTSLLILRFTIFLNSPQHTTFIFDLLICISVAIAFWYETLRIWLKEEL
ncbi:MAG: winged helix-turn-helix domain-containing protein [Candidatus Freyarchaeota archaeon]